MGREFVLELMFCDMICYSCSLAKEESGYLYNEDVTQKPFRSFPRNKTSFLINIIKREISRML